ncbi:hypothetical protein MPER_15716, partial [Moniliophthora perniciosa FA553]
NVLTLKRLQQERRGAESEAEQVEELVNEDRGDIVQNPDLKPDQFWPALQKVCKEVGGDWEKIIDRVWAFGPQKAGGCILIDARKDLGGQS